jgi:hypothetical protein
MENNQCPNCKAELAEKQECSNCSTSTAQSGPAIPALAESPDTTRNVKPLSPVQTPETAPKKVVDEKLQAAPNAQTPRAPHAAAQQDPGLAFLSSEARNLGPLTKRIFEQNLKKKGRNIAAEKYSECSETQIGQVNQHFYESRERSSDLTTVSLMEVTVKLAERETQIPRQNSYVLDPHLGKLRDQHVLFLSCIDQTVALGAAYALLDALNIASEQRFLLNFPRGTEKSNVVIEVFTQLSSEDRHKPTAIVIDGFNLEARAFLDWLQAAPLTLASTVRSHLHGHGFFLLCLVAPEYLQNYSGTPTFARWSVPFLQPLLKHHFPSQAESLEKEILAQQQHGQWKQTDAELCNEIRALLESDLPKIVEQRHHTLLTPPTTVPSIGPESLFKGDNSIEDTLLYAATYFSDLPPHEFDQLVDWLLADRTTTVTVKTQQHNADGTIHTIETEVQKPLRDFWYANSDSYLTSCGLEAATGPNLTTFIRFANKANREKLKAYLERHHSLYLLRQFKILVSNNFLTSEPNIRDRAMSLSIEMATAYPGSFGKDWLLKIILDARNGTKPFSNTDNATATFGKNKALERITLFVRLLLGRPQLEELVNELLKDLMGLGSHETVLFLVRGLQFAPAFDEFYWMKRLLDEGDDTVKHGTYYHLYSYIQKIGIYPLLSKLEPWIPADDRPVDSYSPSCIYSLRLLVEYCSELTATFEQEATAPRHPLFMFTDEKAARENCRRLISWFFHPGMQSVFADLNTVFGDERPDARVQRFICELMLEWTFVLREQETTTSATDTKWGESIKASTGSEQLLSVARTEDFLIESLALVATANQRGQILLYWERLRNFMGLIVNLSDASLDWFGPLNFDEKKAMLATRRLVKDLIKRFRTAIRAIKQRNGKALVTV